jgi:capsular polysaccharide transport system permease protein
MPDIKSRRLAQLIIGVPMLVATLYYGIFAADRYVSESIIAVRDSGDTSSAGFTSGLAMLVAGANPPSRQDTLYLMDYIYSMDMLKHLDGKLNLREAFGAAPLDGFFNLYGWTSQEWFREYFQSRVEVVFDDASSLLTIRVEGFEPAFAHALGTEILAQSERFVNEISHRMAREQMAFAEHELQKSRERYQLAKTQLIDFQNRHNLLDPVAEAQAAVSLGSQLEADLARLEAELKNLLTYLKDNAHEVVSLRNKIGALRDQLELELSKTASNDGNQINTLASEFQSLSIEVGFAQDAYKLALSTVENARIEASRKLKSLVVIESPTLPEIAIYPRRLYNLATIAIALTLLFGIVRLVVATIKDHQD